MKDLTPKVNNDPLQPEGRLTAEEFNDFANDVQNGITSSSGQTLTANVGEDNQQLSKAIGIGGKWQLKATTYVFIIGDHIVPDNSGGVWTGDAPASPADGQKFFIKLLPGSLETNTVTISGNGNDIGEAAETSILIDIEEAEVEFRFDAANTIWLTV